MKLGSDFYWFCFLIRAAKEKRRAKEQAKKAAKVMNIECNGCYELKN